MLIRKIFFLKNHYICRMISKADILAKLIELKPMLREEYAVLEIGLFGSYADSSNTEESDIDILVVLDHPIGWKFFSLEFFLESVFKNIQCGFFSSYVGSARRRHYGHGRWINTSKHLGVSIIRNNSPLWWRQTFFRKEDV